MTTVERCSDPPLSRALVPVRVSLAPPAPRRGYTSNAPAPIARAARTRPTILLCGTLPAEVARLLDGRALEVTWAVDADAVIRGIERGSPLACFIAGDVEGATPAELVERVGALYRPPPCLVVLDDQTWSHAQACRDAGAVDVIHHGDWASLLEALRAHAPRAFAVNERAEAVLPLVATVGGETYAVESTDLRENGIALRGFPDVPIGRAVRLRLDVGDNEVWLRGEVARAFDRDGARLVAVRFVDVAPEIQQWIARTITDLQVRGPSALEQECWRAEIRRTIQAAFEARPVDLAPFTVRSLPPPRHAPTWRDRLRRVFFGD